MNQEILAPLIVNEGPEADQPWIWQSYLPAAGVIAASLALVMARMNIGGEGFISDSALMMLALASYLIAAVFYLTNFYAPFRFAERLGHPRYQLW